MPTPKKLPSGHWRIRIFECYDAQGKARYKSITRETKQEALEAAAHYVAVERKENRAAEARKKARGATVGEVVDKYIDLCASLSPSTVFAYQKMRRTCFLHLWDVPVSELDDLSAQEAINTEARREGRRGPISAKTLSNEWGLVAAALHRVCHKQFDVRLPRRPRRIYDYPDPAAVIDAVRGTNIELPCLLALWLSFSMSEIRGLQFDDVKDGVVTVRRVIIDVDNVPVVKDTAKTDARIRRHRLPPYLLQLIKQADHSQPWIVPLTWNQIRYSFDKICRNAGLDLTFHQLRHLNASVMLALGVPDKYAMERGGWATPHVMRTVYQHTFSAQRVRIDDTIDAYFSALLQGDDTTACSEALNLQGLQPMRRFDPPRVHHSKSPDSLEK